MSKSERKAEDISAASEEEKSSPSRYYLRLPLDDTKSSIYGCSQVFDFELPPLGLALIEEQLELWRTALYYDHNGEMYKQIKQLLFCCHPLLSRDRGGTIRVQFGSGDLRRDLRFVVSCLPKASELIKQMLQYLSMILRRKGLVPLSIDKVLQFVGVPSALSSALFPHISPLCCKPKENISPHFRLVQTEAPVRVLEVSLYGNFRGPYAAEKPAVQDKAESTGNTSAVSVSSEPSLKRRKKTLPSTSA